MTHDLLSDELSLPSPGALLLPLMGSLIVTGAVAAFICLPPTRALPLPALLALAGVYLLITAVSHAGSVWLVHRLFHEFLPWPTKALIIGLWSTVAWLPLLTVLTSRDSLWVAGSLPLITSCAVSFMKRSQPPDSQLDPAESAALFQPAPAVPFWRAILPSVLAAAALEAGVFALALQHPWFAGLLFAAGTSLPVWRLVGALRQGTFTPKLQRWRTPVRDAAAAWLLTAIALLPFSSSGALAKALGRHGASAHSVVHRARSPTKAFADADGPLQFVVLTQPARPHDRRITAPLGRSSNSAPAAEPVVIPFDGPYWFFKHAGDTPGPASHRERGDPRKVNIRSTDGLPILMEAHQTLAPPLELGDSSQLRVDLTNADDRPGAIYAEVVLQEQVMGQSIEISLGALPLPSSTSSSIALGRAPVQDSLAFALPKSAHRGYVNQITIRFKPDPARSLAAPLVAIRDFVVMP